LVKAKRLSVVGVDYDGAYIQAAGATLAAAGLADDVTLHCMSVYDKALPDVTNADALPFDAVYFSGSVTLLPDPVDAIKQCARLLKPGGLVYITQTFQKKAVPGMATLKPLVKHVLTIDFGPLFYERDLKEMLRTLGMHVSHLGCIDGSVDNQFQAANLVVLDPGRPLHLNNQELKRHFSHLKQPETTQPG
jgi:SAM-dependent methyltransferase